MSVNMAVAFTSKIACSEESLASFSFFLSRKQLNYADSEEYGYFAYYAPP